MTTQPPAHSPRSVDAVVVGAGFAGLYMLYRLRQLGLQMAADGYRGIRLEPAQQSAANTTAP